MCVEVVRIWESVSGCTGERWVQRECGCERKMWEECLMQWGRRIEEGI